MSKKEIVIESLSYSSRSTGSIDPRSFAYEKQWSYRPTLEESVEILKNTKVNGKVTLLEYFEAMRDSNEKLLDSIAHKPDPNAKPAEVAPGSTSKSWSIRTNVGAISNGGKFLVSEFPKVIFEKGEMRGLNADGMGPDGLVKPPIDVPKPIKE